MNPHKTALRLLIVTQVFALFFLMLMPAVIRWLGDPLGKALYGLLVAVSIGLALALRYALASLD